MKKSRLLIGAAIIAIGSFIAVAADHIDAPAVTGTSSDITDFYAFEGLNGSTIAFAVNTQGLTAPMETDALAFDEDVLYEINIDTNADAVEDFVIQAIPRNGKMYVFGPEAPTSTGLNSTILLSTPMEVDITAYGQNAITASENGMSIFAGPRDDPFFMDFVQYGEIIAGNATAFNNPGDDTFAGTNVLSLVVEVPKSMIGGTGSVNTWVETKRKQ
ncbi:MAG: DUF4331 family protein [Bacteroidota bacterium]